MSIPTISRETKNSQFHLNQVYVPALMNRLFHKAQGLSFVTGWPSGTSIARPIVPIPPSIADDMKTTSG